MKVYFAGAIYGGRGKLSTYIEIQKIIESLGHEFLTKHVTGRGNSREEEFVSPSQNAFERDIKLLEKADCLIAEITVPSLGVGYEISYAVEKRKIPVLALYEKDKENKVSAMIRSNTSENFQAKGYEEDEFKQIIKDFLEDIK